MLKGKNVTVDLPEIPSLSDFQEHATIATTIIGKRSELEAVKGRANQLRSELGRCDVAEFNPRKAKLQSDLRAQLPAQAQLEEELRRLEPAREQVVNELSGRLCREVFDAAVRTMRRQHAQLLAEVATLEERIETYLEKIEQAGYRTGSLPRSMYLANLGRLSDRNSMISRVVAHGGVEEADGSTAPVKAAS